MSARLTDTSFNWLCNPRRAAVPKYGIAEFLWYMSGTDDIRMIKHYAPQYERFAENGRAHGAYGRRIFADNQIERVIKTLQHCPETRQAIIALWSAEQDSIHAIKSSRKDLPCTLTLQFLIRGDRLCCVASMRSNDIWLGLPYDVFCFTSLQRAIATELNIKAGWYQHNVGSLHLYERNEVAANEALKTSYHPSRTIESTAGDRVSFIDEIITAEENIRAGCHYKLQYAGEYHSDMIRVLNDEVPKSGAWNVYC